MPQVRLGCEPEGRGPGCSAPVTLRNPLSSEQRSLRPTTLIELLRAVRRNQSVGQAEIALCELGRVWPGTFDDEGVPIEERRLGIVLAGAWQPRQWHSAVAPFDIYDLVGVLEDLRDVLGIGSYAQTATEHPSLMPGQALAITCAGSHAGVAGALHPEIARAFDIDTEVFVAELSFDALVQATSGGVGYQPPPRFPAVERDLAVVVGVDVLVGDLVDTAKRFGAPLLSEVAVFDVYRGGGIPAGKKSVALGLHYRDPDKTLTDLEVDDVHAAVERALADAHGAVRR